VRCSGEGVNTDHLSASGGVTRDELNVTRLCTGNDSDFMEMTACVGGLMADVEPDSLILSPVFEQENNANRWERGIGLVDAHNKSVVFYGNDSDDRDVSLTCDGHGGIISLGSAPLGSGSDGRGPNKTVLYDGVDMEMTQCMSLNASSAAKLGEDAELTRCLPLDASMSVVKSTCRWPFGKRQDGPRERVSRYEDNTTTTESLSLNRDGEPFVELDDLDVSAKVDTLEFLQELNREIDSTLSENHDVPLSVPSSVTSRPVASASADDGKATEVNTDSASVNEQGSDRSPKKITDREDGEISFKRGQLLGSSSSSSASDAAAVGESGKADVDIVASSAIYTSETFTADVRSVVSQHGQASAGSLRETAAESSMVQSAMSVCSTSMAMARPKSNPAALSSSAASLPVPDVVNQAASHRGQLEKSLRGPFPEETWNLGDMSSRVKSGADIVESIFAVKDSDVVLPSTSMVIETAPLATAVADSTLTAKQVKTTGLRDLDRGAAFTHVAETGFPEASTAYSQTVGSEAETEARRLLRRAAQITVSADDLLPRVKLANSILQQATAKVREYNPTAGVGYCGFSRPANSALKQNPAYQPSDKPVGMSSAFQRYVPDLDQTKESNRSVNVGEIAGNNSRMDLSAYPVERTENVTHSLVSVNITDNFDATKQEEVNLEPISDITDITLPNARMDLSTHSVSLTHSLVSVNITVDAAKQQEVNHLQPVGDAMRMNSGMDISAEHVDETDALGRGLTSVSLAETQDATSWEEVHLEPIRDVTQLSSSCSGDRVESLETCAAANMEPPLSAKPRSTFDSTFKVPAKPVASKGSESCLSSSGIGGEVENLEASAATDIVELSSLAKQCSQFGSTFTVPVTSVALHSSTFCLPATTTTATGSTADITSRHLATEELTGGNSSVRLPSHLTVSRGANVDVDVGRPGTSESTELETLEAKSSARSAEESWSLSGVEVSQSSVFSLAAGTEATPMHSIHALSRDARPVSVSGNQVHTGGSLLLAVA